MDTIGSCVCGWVWSSVLDMTSLVNLPELERQIAAHQTLVGDLTLQLETAKNRLATLHSIRRSASLFDAQYEFSKAETVVNVEDALEIELHDPTPVEPGMVRIIDGGPKKIRSTQMVAELINDSDEMWERGDIHDAFQMRYSVPESWSNPTNAINNAIGRAVKHGLIAERGGLYMAPSVAFALDNDGDRDG